MLLKCPASGEEITRKITGGFGQQESAIYDVLRRAQSEGSFDSSVDASALIRFFLSVAQGLNVVNKAMADPGIPKNAVRIAVTVWETTSPGLTFSRRFSS
jgi:hypothetical protein